MASRGRRGVNLECLKNSCLKPAGKWAVGSGTQGATMEETRKNLKKAVQLMLEAPLP